MALMPEQSAELPGDLAYQDEHGLFGAHLHVQRRGVGEHDRHRAEFGVRPRRHRQGEDHVPLPGRLVQVGDGGGDQQHRPVELGDPEGDQCAAVPVGQDVMSTQVPDEVFGSESEQGV